MELRNVRLKDVLNPRKWVSVVVSYYTSRFLYTLSDVEQIHYRMLECSDCMERGSCIHCGCDMVKLLNKEETCSAGKWGPTKSKEDWKAYKKEHGIKFGLKTNFDEQ